MLRALTAGRRERAARARIAELEAERRQLMYEYTRATLEHFKTDFDTGTRPYSGKRGATEARETYDHAPLMAAAIDTVVALAVGDGLTLGQLDDPAAQDTLEAWYRHNDIGTLSREQMRAWLLDGAVLLLLADDADPSSPAWVNPWDWVKHPVKLETEPGNPRNVTSVTVHGTNGARTIQPEHFVLRQNQPASGTERDALGRSPVATIVPPARAHERVLQYRLRLHELRARINAVYTTLADSPEEMQLAIDRVTNIPPVGQVITVRVDPETGYRESFELTTPNVAGGDAENDLRAFTRAVASGAGIPEHYLAIGDTGNRSTSESMAEPMVRRMEQCQHVIVGIITEAARKELRRVHGDRTFRELDVETDGLERTIITRFVTADQLTIPLDAPPVRNTETDTDRVLAALDHDLISNQTATRELGFDPALEAELKAGEDDTEQGGGTNDEPEPIT